MSTASTPARIETVAVAAAARGQQVTEPDGEARADEAQAAKPRGATAAPKPNDKALASPAASVARADAARNPKADDADVLLLSALLAHVSRTDANGALPEQDQITIAQLVKRCDARAPDEARECRRRICAGYWGKAEACPAPATPKKG